MPGIARLPLVVLLVAAGCTAGAEHDDSGTSQGALLDAAPTREHPEVGMWALAGRTHACTGTLVSPRVVVTAAHCADFVSRDARGLAGAPLGVFVVEDVASGQRSGYGIDAVKSFGMDIVFTSDVALLHLAEPVPASIATPARLADTQPAAGAGARLFGYGCTDRDDQSQGRGTKRAVTVRIGESSRRLCPWDSGGPTLLVSTGEVVQVNSYFDQAGRDAFAPLAPLAPALAAQIARWSAEESAPPPPPSGGGQDT